MANNYLGRALYAPATERTTDLDKLMAGAPFTWGKPIQFIPIERYMLLAFHPWEQNGSRIVAGVPNERAVQYFGYIDGRSLSESWTSLDAALIGLVARAHDEQHAQVYIQRMLGMD